MTNQMVFELVPRNAAPAEAGARRPGPRAREGAPARSFEDVLRGLDRTGRASRDLRTRTGVQPTEERARKDDREPETAGTEQAAGDAAPQQAPGTRASAAGRDTAGSDDGAAREAGAEETEAVPGAGEAGTATAAARPEGLLAALASVQGMVPSPAPPGGRGPQGPSTPTGGEWLQAATLAGSAPQGSLQEELAPRAPRPEGALAGSIASAAAAVTAPAAPLEGAQAGADPAAGQGPEVPSSEPARPRAGAAVEGPPPSGKETVEALLQALAGTQGQETGRAPHEARSGGDAPATAGSTAAEGRSQGPAAGSGSSQAASGHGGTAAAESPAAGVPLAALLSEAGAARQDAVGAGLGHGGRDLPDPHAAGPQAATQGTARGAVAPAEAPNEASTGPEPRLQGAVLSGTAAPESVAPAQPAALAGTSQADAGSPARGGEPLASMPMAQVGETVVKRLQQLRNPGADELRLELEPKELGALKIRLELRGDGVKAHFVVDRPVVQAMLERAMAELRQSLAQQGYRVDELQVALQGDGQARGQGGEQGGRPGRGHGRRVTGTEGVAPVPEPAGQARWAGAGRIDIRA
ncbi:flagellar hook-length control protein FliK [Limnochorda pilosa]|uniref:Flagellar hook-length control protein-like C-terminal domain-containing protein n=1 Tax=Limnochorda pilosa TaxID=1555112 RepID=A0A0K2SK61_LIMPI|nr:flagellar hook-length control protein FliK [Limnochorda pilosa]BAS27503.1 hypothetical protein LIP_1657 [Limnochorda pilosa]